MLHPNSLVVYAWIYKIIRLAINYDVVATWHTHTDINILTDATGTVQLFSYIPQVAYSALFAIAIVEFSLTIHTLGSVAYS